MNRRAHRVWVVLVLGCGRVIDSGPAKPAAALPELNAVPAPTSTACADEPGMAYIPGGVLARYNTVIRPASPVPVDPLWIDRYETTVEEYAACVEAGACTVPHRSTSGWSGHTSQMVPLVCTWELEGEAGLPINCMDGDQHDAYCRFRGKRTPFAHELLWVMTNRDANSAYPWGDAPPPTCDLAIVDEDTDDDEAGCGRNRPWPVGSRPTDVTRDGVYDMAGNIGEKSLSPFRPDHPVGELRKGVGGAWSVHLSPRGSWSSSDKTGYSDNSGFRCAKDPSRLPPCTVAP